MESVSDPLLQPLRRWAGIISPGPLAAPIRETAVFFERSRMRIPLIAGNWKMNTTLPEAEALAREMREANARGERLGLTEDELAFYDALETNDSAVKVLGEPTLMTIARELAEAVRNNVTIDWTVRENVRAHLRVLVKRILRKYGYPPDKQEKATQTVLEQAEVLSEVWAAA